MPKANKTKVKSVKEKQEAGEVLSSTDPLQHSHEDGTVHSHEGGDSEHTHEEVVVNTNSILTKEEWCKANDIARPGSNYAETEYAKYLAGGA